MNRTIKVQYYGDDSLKDKKDLEWPQNYENFVEDIRKKFNLGNKTEITLKLITEDDDPYDTFVPGDTADWLNLKTLTGANDNKVLFELSDETKEII